MRLESLILRLLRLALSRGVRQSLSGGLRSKPRTPAERKAGGQAGAARQAGRRAGQMLRITRKLR